MVFSLSFVFTLDPTDFVTLIPHVSVSFFISPFLSPQASLPLAVALLPTMYSDSDSESSESDTVVTMFEEEVFTRQYTVLKTLGQGGTSDVRLCSHRLTGAPVAVKALLRERWSDPTVPEADIMKMLSHPNIVSLVQIIETEHTTYLIMEVARGEELLKRVRDAGCLKEDEARSIFIQLLSAIGYCHGKGVVHRDIKPDNIIVGEDGKATLIDFSLGDTFLPGQKLERLCGAFQFIAPEIFRGLPYDGTKVDMWALGVILYYMTTGFLPFGGGTLSELSNRVMNGKYRTPDHLSDDIRSMISLLLTVNPRQRPNAQELVSHPWLQQGGKTLTFHYNSDTRFPDPDIMGAMESIGFHSQDIREALKHKEFDETRATYHLLKSLANQDDGNYVQRDVTNPGVTPFPSPTDPSTYPLPPRRRASEPSLKIRVSSTGQRPGETNAPVAPKKTPPMGSRQQRRMTAPCICIATYTVVEVIETLDNTFSSSSQFDKAPSEPERRRPFTPRPPQPQGWAKWKKRISNCIRTLCCCCMSPDTTSRRKVCPQKREDTPKMTRSTRHLSGTFLYLLNLFFFTNICI